MADFTQSWKESGDVGIPAPSGRFAVGCVDLMHHLDGDEEGGLLVRLFYPTASPKDIAAAGEMQRRYPYAKWLPNPRYVKPLAGRLDRFMTVFVQEAVALGGRPVVDEFVAGLKSGKTNPKMPAHEGAPVLTASAPPSTPDRKITTQEAMPYPAIVFSHGLGGMRTMGCAVCCDLASHGFVVAAVDHRDSSTCISNRRVPHVTDEGVVSYSDEWLPYYELKDNEEEFPLRNKQVHQRANDIKRSLDLLGLLNEGARIENMMDGDFDFSQFKGRIDVGTAAVMGHSFGGATTVQTLSEDPRFSCGIALDTWMAPIHQDLYEVGLQRPLLFINSSDFQWVENVQQMMKLSRAPDENGMSTCRVVTLRDTNHLSQCELALLLPTDVKYQIEIFSLNVEVCHSFLKRHLLRDPDYVKPVPNLDGLDDHSEYLIFGTNLDLGTGTMGGGKVEQHRIT